ncbi:50S ribosomal protein L10 [Corynebacterium jeikeium]|jgi:large subunit ribosomal protein L10|uniref:Large ribosomal subunit protein uL10 n=2 Tax=Corynebacterium TaxID=1716 RepID=RL10_CORJK|nr:MULTISPECIES: 50S ribosomal protein L10 [Bacteria]Q4JT29.1 RecName: Full=Large ribosomal subunit protein uL10; AltName: Full=50S ribosomal protein L10 [Corynebacterium jeikeium K411]ALW70815.1 50S ribosomal protein L10 [Campylobacter jejuni]EEW15879.1 ribosomal protein L10 [Corynebacterium jeikeium ATCC 43734]MCG7258421.1 50S ribosomal protein L10 [Corynebacterium sp. ACRQK]MCG7262966.1 50S ribosomal protein L10 [Corynebacterium sp. ACRQL]MCG7266956.1 50S ribosomal protein L10 [Corynebacte
MANPKNTASLEELKARFEQAQSTLLTEYRGLSVAETTELRRALGSDVTYSVAKNTMIKLAAREAGIELDESLLTGPTAIAFVNGEAVDAAKAMKDFGKDHKNFVIKGGYMDGATIDAAQVEAIAELDNRETTLAKLAGAMQGSLAKAAGLFNAPASQVARLAAALQEKKEQ